MAVLELRYFLPRYTMADLENGVQSQRLPIGPAVDGHQPTALFSAPRLQYRVRSKEYVNGQATTKWSEWATVGFVREGEDDGPPPPPAGAIDGATS